MLLYFPNTGSKYVSLVSPCNISLYTPIEDAEYSNITAIKNIAPAI